MNDREKREFSEQWYAVRLKRIQDWAEETGNGEVLANIIANGTSEVTEPPTYDQQMNILRHELDKEREARREAWSKYEVERLEVENLKSRLVKLAEAIEEDETQIGSLLETKDSLIEAQQQEIAYWRSQQRAQTAQELYERHVKIVGERHSDTSCPPASRCMCIFKQMVEENSHE